MTDQRHPQSPLNGSPCATSSMQGSSAARRTKRGRRKRRRRIRHESAALASTLLAAYCLCSSGGGGGNRDTSLPTKTNGQLWPWVGVEAFSSTTTVSLSSAGTSQKLEPATSESRIPLFATIENDSRSGTSSDEDDDDDVDNESPRSSYYRLHSTTTNARRSNGHSAVDAWSQEMQAAQQALEQLNTASTSRTHRSSSSSSSAAITVKEPFYAKLRTSTLAALPNIKKTTTTNNGKTVKKNGKTNHTTNGQKVKVNGFSRSPTTSIPRPLHYNPSTTTSDAANTTTTDTDADGAADDSRRRRIVSTVRKVWGNVSPIRIFGRVFDSSVDTLDATIRTSTNRVTLAENSETNSTTTSTKKKRTKEEKKQSKEEAIVARMSRKKKKQLSSLLQSVNRRNTKSMAGMTARTLTGLLSALAEESEGLSVRMHAREDTPIWRKEIDNLSIEFTRLGFKPLSMGGPDQQLAPSTPSVANAKKGEGATKERKTPFTAFKKATQHPKAKPPRARIASTFIGANDVDDSDSCPVEVIDESMLGVSCADTAFDAIDVDKSGALDKDEIADALAMAATSGTSSSSKQSSISDSLAGTVANDEDRKVINQLAKQLVDLYDTNEDGVIDRMEYQSMVEDMAALRQVQKEREQKLEEKQRQDASSNAGDSWWSSAVNTVLRGNYDATAENDETLDDETLIQQLNEKEVIDISDDPVTDDILVMTESALQDDDTPENMGKIELEDLKIDLRQLVFGAMPGVKHVR